MNNLITPDTIIEHLQRIQDAQMLYDKFRRPETLAYLNTLHEHSTRYLVAMSAELKRNREVMKVYDEAAKVMKVVRR